MNTSSVLKKRIMIFGFSLIFISICIIVTFLFNSNSKNDLVVNKKNIQVTYENAKGGINTSEYPLTYEEGNLKSPSNIVKISNKLDKSVDYEIVITTEKTDDNSLEENKIYVSVDSGEGVILSSVPEGVIYTNTLHKYATDIVDLKIWIASELVDTSDNGKSLGINVEVREK